MRVGFVHPSEQEFARFLDYSRIRWVYEPASFPIGWEDGRVNEMFTPDFYLPESDMYVELTTMRQSLVTPKNRKVRLLRELYPEINVRLLYQKDYQQLLVVLRSEEHTSELQSHSDLVCRLLLEKKKKNKISTISKKNVIV